VRTLWITGAGGVVGQKLVQQAAVAGTFERICAFTHRPTPSAPAISLPPTPLHEAPGPEVRWEVLDIGDRAAVQARARALPPQLILNPAAMTNVDACERARDEAVRANADGPRHLAEIARAVGAPLVHVSTDYVFPGDAVAPGPYAEDAAPHPVNWYGETKLAGERAIQEVCADGSPWLIVRTALVYGFIPGGRTNFVTWLAGELRAGRPVRIVRDQFNTPTLADDLAATLLWLAANGRTGLYHVAGPELVGRHEWALAIAAHFGLDPRPIAWVTSEELAQPARRPLRSGLRCERLARDGELGAPHPRGIAAGLAAIAAASGMLGEPTP
jgi:dTDP-4-dehydrorhamnose reductase